MSPNDPLAPEEAQIRRIRKAGLATDDQIEEARAIRRKMVEMGLRPRTVGEVLVEKGHIDQEDLEAIAQADAEVGERRQIAGYELLEVLGEGSHGTVYKARQLSLDRIVAIRVLEPGEDRDRAARFLEEARKVARISHTNLVSGIDVGEADGVCYLVMDFADGITLGRVLARGGAMDEERSLDVALQLARALEHAHKQGMVHGEVRPEQVIVTSDGVAKLCDLGLAGLGGEEKEDDEEGPRRAPEHMSPEQARAADTVGPATDVYSLGAVLFHMLLGRPPFPAADWEAIVARHLTEPAPSVRSLAPDVTEATDGIVAACLVKAPDDRPDASQLVRDLAEALRALRQARREGGGAPAPSRRSSSAAPRPQQAAGPTSGAGGAPAAPTPRRRRRRR